MGMQVKDFENKVYKALEKEGFDVLRSGYPDFFVRRNGRYGGVAAVEVKQGSDKVRDNQKEMHKLFNEAGIPVYVIRPENVYGKDNMNIRNPMLKKRFKKVIGLTHYTNIKEKVTSLSSKLKYKEDYTINLIQNMIKEMDEIREEVKSLVSGLEVESIILKENKEDNNE
jgi:Holliday junction resolvase